MKYITLNNGAKIPKLGYGVYQTSVQDTEKCMLEAIEAGYHSIGVAQACGNEDGVEDALAACSLLREGSFITAKVWITNVGREKARRSIDGSLEKLKTDHMDLLLIHQPSDDYYGTYRTVEETYGAGKIQAIGVSNLYPGRLIDLCRFVEIKPATNQVEIHVFQQQKKAHEIMKRYNVQIEPWGPFVEGRKDSSNNSILNEIGSRYGKFAAQTALRFLIQRDVVVIPETTHGERMKENINVFDFVLTDEEMEILAGLDQGESTSFSHYDPETVEFLTDLEI